MTYTITGTGNMAWFLAGRMHQAGFECRGVYGRNAAATAELAEHVSGPAIYSLADLPEADCTILAVPDHAIRSLANALSPQCMVIHTAGSVPLEMLPQAEKAVLWPVYSIKRSQLPQHRGIPVVLEASSAAALQLANTVAEAVSDSIGVLNYEQRIRLHLGAVLANNFTNHLLAVAEQICIQNGLSFRMLLPIIEQTISQAHHTSPLLLQTGPAVRGDHDTMQHHLQLLSDHPAWKRIYEAISASIEDMYTGTKKEKP